MLSNLSCKLGLLTRAGFRAQVTGFRIEGSRFFPSFWAALALLSASNQLPFLRVYIQLRGVVSCWGYC